jgi:hypothetical protein
LSETANGTLRSYTYPTTSNRLTDVKRGAAVQRLQPSAMAPGVRRSKSQIIGFSLLRKRLLTLYDAAGNMTRDTRGATADNYVINAAGRIRTLTIGTTLRATFRHRRRYRRFTAEKDRHDFADFGLGDRRHRGFLGNPAGADHGVTRLAHRLLLFDLAQPSSAAAA